MATRGQTELVSLREDIARLREDIAALTERVSSLLELRTANGALYSTRFEAFEERCDERYEQMRADIEVLKMSERRSATFMARLQGMAAPAAIFVAIVSLILTFVH